MQDADIFRGCYRNAVARIPLWPRDSTCRLVYRYFLNAKFPTVAMVRAGHTQTRVCTLL